VRASGGDKMIQWSVLMRTSNVYFDQFLKFHLKILIGYFNSEAGREVTVFSSIILFAHEIKSSF
jgi:hypothetical protein